MSTSDTAAPGTGDLTANPRWRYFAANPTLDSPTQVPTNSVVGCWRASGGLLRSPDPAARTSPTSVRGTRLNLAPTFTTIGNNANTHEAWLSPLTPGGTAQAPVSPDPGVHDRSSPTLEQQPVRRRRAEARRQRHQRLGGPPVRRPQPDARLLLLPRLHREELQPAARQRRPGRPGRRPGGRQRPGRRDQRRQPTFQGRDNANQIALQDGIPGITNQYLFEPIAGAFYAPCTDGGLDMGIVGHEYTHAISNRMVGGPDEGTDVRAGRRDGRVVGRPGRRRVPVRPRLQQRRQRLGRRRLRHRQHRDRDPRLLDRQEPAELLRLRVRHHRHRGPRRRRDLERHDVGGPPGARREVRRRSSPTPTRPSSSPAPTARRRRRRCGRPVPGQPALGAADVRRVPAPAGRRPPCSTPATR